MLHAPHGATERETPVDRTGRPLRISSVFAQWTRGIGLVCKSNSCRVRIDCASGSGGSSTRPPQSSSGSTRLESWVLAPETDARTGRKKDVGDRENDPTVSSTSPTVWGVGPTPDRLRTANAGQGAWLPENAIFVRRIESDLPEHVSELALDGVDDQDVVVGNSIA